MGGIFSYEEHLKMMVLKEEFFPLMEEVKNSVSLMIKGANGNAFFKKSTQNSKVDFYTNFSGSWSFFVFALRAAGL